ncbi:MAG: hypothetical protein LIO45_03035 [Clostridiales bacterium]|nr:hypothetical protein [Clostridiales bacterium]
MPKPPDRIRFGASFRLSDPEQARAWSILSAFPARQRMPALAHMICRYQDMHILLDELRQLLREELSACAASHETVSSSGQAGDADADVLGFLYALQRGDDDR